MTTYLAPLLPLSPVTVSSHHSQHPQHSRAAAPAAAPAVPPRRAVPAFPPIRRGAGGRHRLQQAVRHRPGVVVAGLLAAATALASGPLRPGSPPPAASSAAAAEPAGTPRCTGTPPAGR
ncbi:hypothetical protein GCM10010193_63570 [Kitasatospora atroaurantiaca]|uniref:Uncharacterized protein n=1 Tax=Kitasatospora atroaurantiaca TaxID=285545 RepID=A0A561EU41_9ACTN|nr:hypothetical protein [Kitasatospora atroaurantiaca]TWE19133.1 hypothetical protein FB465_4237 [Kitasatospora atroaurantiaca]